MFSSLSSVCCLEVRKAWGANIHLVSDNFIEFWLWSIYHRLLGFSENLILTTNCNKYSSYFCFQSDVFTRTFLRIIIVHMTKQMYLVLFICFVLFWALPTCAWGYSQLHEERAFGARDWTRASLMSSMCSSTFYLSPIHSLSFNRKISIFPYSIIWDIPKYLYYFAYFIIYYYIFIKLYFNI